MKIKEVYKKVVRDVFFYLVIITVLFSLYQHFNPLFLPGLKTKLIIVTIVFGILWACLSFIPDKKIKLRVKEFKDVKKKLMIFLTGFIFYSFFLNWAYAYFSFDDFMFFVLLLYIPISYILGLESRIPIAIGLILLIFCGIISILDKGNYAEKIAIYAYYFLVVGIILVFIKMFPDNLTHFKIRDFRKNAIYKIFENL